MTSVSNRRCAAVLLAILATAAASAQVLPPRDAPPSSQQKPAVGTGVISGTVSMAGSTQPARKVRVSLSGAEIGRGRTAVTDDRGEFSFTALPAGRYNLTANKPGHVSVTYGQWQPGRPGTPIQLSDGQKFRADLQIPRGSVITGTVLDEHGEPTPQISVRVMRVVTQNGGRTLQSSNSSSTDDRGIYRAYGLLPGEYVVCATPRNTALASFDRMQVELRALETSMTAVERANPEQARAVARRIESLRAAMPEETDEVPPGYAPVCYPGTVSASAATPITIGIAEERPGVDFQLQLAPLARIEGMVLNSTGANVRQLNIRLEDAQQGGVSIGNMTTRADADGRFRFANVPPGQYRLTVRGNVAPEREPQAARGGRGRGGAPAAEPRPAPIALWGAADVTVDGRNLSNVMLSLQRGVPVSGQVTFDGSTPPPPDLTRIRITMSPTGPSPFGGASSVRLDADGRFTIPSVPPGLYRLSAGGAGGWSVESSVIGGQDALDFPFEVKGDQAIGGAVITLTDRQTELTGLVSNDQNQPAPEFTLVLFPADSRYWNGTSRRMQTTRPATDGRYTFRNLPPGDYRLAPVYDLPPGAHTDPAFLQQLETTALRVTLQPGEKKTQDMRVGGM